MSITLPLRQSMSASLIGRSGSSAFRLSTQPAVLVERGIAEELEQFLNRVVRRHAPTAIPVDQQ